MLKIIGVTGGVGSGKSTVLDFLEKEYGAYIIMADEIGRKLMEPEGVCFDRIVKAFGEAVLTEDGRLNRGLLSERIFSDSEARDILDGIVHPAVKKEIQSKVDSIKSRYTGGNFLVVIEAALLIEESYDLICDELWYIYASVETRIKRLKEYRGYSEDKSLSIMKNQLSDEMMRKYCVVTIDNSGNFEDTRSQLAEEYNRVMDIK